MVVIRINSMLERVKLEVAIYSRVITWVVIAELTVKR